MDIVKNLVLYQIVKSRKFSVGDKIIFNENTITGQYEKVYNTKFIIGDLRIADIFYNLKQNKKLFKKNIKQIGYLSDNYDLLLRELALEKIRKQFYSNLPSRLHCMYLSFLKETAINNFETSKEKHLQVVAVRLNGKIFKSGDFSLDRNGGSFKDYETMAHDYWSQTNIPDEDIKEVLFEGVAEIIEIIKER